MVDVIECPAPGRREARRLDRREAIVTLAARWFLDHGYAGTTMSAVAAALGGSKGTLWRYFPSKEALFAAVIDQRSAAYRARLSALLDPCEDLAATLHRFCVGLLHKIFSPEAIALHRLVVAEAGRFPEVGRIFHERGPLLMQRVLADFLEGAMARSLLRPDDPLATARALIALCLAGSHQQRLFGVIEEVDEATFEADVSRALAVFLPAFTLPAADDLADSPSGVLVHG